MNKLSRITKLGYGMGDLASNLVFQLTVIYLLFFYTDILEISAFSAGLIFLVARIWDAVNDPIMGLIVDHTRSKHGKARVYLLYGSAPLAIATILMFYSPSCSQLGKIIYAGFTYIIWGMCYTMVNIPYSSLTSVLTDDPQERTSLSSIRMIFMLVGVILVSVIVEPLADVFPTLQTGYLVVSIIFSSLAFLFFQFCFLATNTKHTTTTVVEEKYSLKEVLPILMQNRQLIIVTLSSLLGSMAIFMRETSAIYYVNYNLGNGDLLPIFLGVVVLSMVIGNLLIPMVTRRFDKKGTFIIGSIVAMIGSMIFHFINYDSFGLIIVFAAFSSVGFAAISTLGWSMVPDTVEYGEYKTGLRTEGIIYAVYSFSQKLATALSGILVAGILQITGYIANNPVQTSTTLTGILSTLTIIPTVFIGASIVVMLFYTIDKESFEKMKKKLGK